MSQENVELMRAVYEAWNVGDMDAFRELYDPDVIVRTVEDWPEPGPYVGREAVMHWFKQLRETWDTDTFELIGDFIDAADHVLVRFIWRGAGQGPESRMEFTGVFTVRKRRVVYLEFFWDHAEALETVGLSERAMSQENPNFEVVRRFHDALNRRDVDAMVAVWDKDAEFRPIMSALDSQVYRGHEGLRAWLDAIFADWEVFEAYDDEFRDFGDSVLSFGHWHACGRASGVLLDIDTAAWLVRVREGKIIWWKTFTDRAEALEAVGLSEQDAHADP